MNTKDKIFSKRVFDNLASTEAGRRQQSRHYDIFYILKADDRDAALCRDILSWVINTSNPTVTGDYKKFRFSELGNWLIDNHKLFRQEFASSRLPKSYRLHSRRNFIQDKIDFLIDLGLIYKEGTVKAEKNNSRVPIYSFSKEAILLGYLIKARMHKGEKRRTAINTILSSFSFFDPGNSQHRVLSIFVKKCMEREVFGNLEDDNVLYVLISCLPDQRLFGVLRQLVFLHTKLKDIFVESIKELNEIDRELVLFQIKLDVEREVTFFASKEWEIMRLKNIQDLANVILQGFCDKCDKVYQFKYDLFQFLDLPDTRTINIDQRPKIQTINCIKCGAKNAMDLIPSWLGIWFHTPLGLTVHKNPDLFLPTS